MWRMPLADDYRALLRSDIADLNNAPPGAEAGRRRRPRCSCASSPARCATAGRTSTCPSPSWIETNEGPLVKGATGWGVRTLLRWLGTL